MSERGSLLHPFLFAAFVPLAFFAQNRHEVPLGHLGPPLAATLLINLTLLGLVRLTPVHPARASLLLSTGWLVFFLYHPLLSLSRLPHRWFLVSLGTALAALAVAVARAKPALLSTLARAATVAAVVVVLGPSLIVAREAAAAIPHAASSPAAAAIRTAPGGEPASTPDIVYLILDGYAGEPTLAAYFGTDNRRFLETLARQGFYVAPASRSNYPTTLYSLASTLNMEYIGTLTPDPAKPLDEKDLLGLIHQARALRVLEQRGYRISFISTSSHLAAVGDSLVDCRRPYIRLNQYLIHLYGFTPLRYFEPLRRSVLGLDHDGKPWVPDAAAWALEQVVGVVRDGACGSGPHFVVAHVLSPHSPYYQDADCALVPRYRETSWDDFNRDFAEYRDAYVQQLACTNRRVERMLEELLAGEHHETIVIIQGDHGPPEILPAVLRRHQPPIDEDRFQFAILNAYRLPPAVAGALDAEISPVNSFRLLLGWLTGSGLPRLPDRSFRIENGRAVPVEAPL